MLDVGAKLPAFSLPDQHGNVVRSQDLLGKGPIVLYFYPKDETAGCTAEACSFRDSYQDFADAGATVVGVSRDGVESHQRFAAHHRLPFTLLADTRGALRRMMRVPKSMGLFDGRVTFVLDRDGVVRHTFRSQVLATRHVSQALQIVQQLAR